MDENTTKIIKEKFDSLPESIKEIIMSSHYEDTLIDVGRSYNLNVEQLGILEREVTLVMMGLTSTGNFETELTRELNVDKIKGGEIVRDLNEKIFLKIRELLKLMNTPIGEDPSLEETEEESEQPKNPDTAIFSSAGIEILSEKKERNELPKENLQVIKNLELTEIPAKNPPPLPPEVIKPNLSDILEQKMSTSFKMPGVKTEYTLNNISKPKNETAVNPPKPSPNTVSYPPKGDPYRLSPDE